MIKKLKVKFVMINMLLLICMLGAIFTGVYLLMQKSTTEEAISIMGEIAQHDGRVMKPKQRRGNSPPPPLEKLRMPNSFSVKLDEKVRLLEVLSEFAIDNSNNTIEEAIMVALKKEKDQGIIKIEDTQLRFLRQEKPYGQIIVFLDRYHEIETLSRLALVLMVIGMTSIVLLFMMSLYLASWAIKPIEKAWEKQKEFIADASHELKTPLTVIQTNTDVILGSEDDTIGSQIKWIGYIKSETERMSKLVNNLLYIAKLDSEEDLGIYVRFNLSDLVLNTVLPFESVIFESDKTFHMEIDPNAYCIGEEERIRQVLVILIDNAVKYSNEKGKIGIGLNIIREKNRISLTVSNSGPSIPVEEISKIFERFYRRDKSRARETGGYGLGLSIAKSIIEQHKGKIRVKSEKGRGTTFEVVLPFSPNAGTTYSPQNH